MSKFTYTPLSSFLNPTSAVSQINANFATLQTLVDTLLSRNGTSPNTMSSDLDMNSQRITNLPEPLNASEPARLQDMNNAVVGTINNLTNAVDDSAAATAGVSVGSVYRNGSQLMVRIS